MSFLHVLFYFCVCSIYSRSSEAASLKCGNTTDVCPDTELTCTCTITGTILAWETLPETESITFYGNMRVGFCATTTLFFAVVTVANTTGGKESVLKSTEPLVNGNHYNGVTLQCKDVVSKQSDSISITVTFAG